MTINIYGKRQFHGNQYIGRTWRLFKTVLSGMWIGTKEMFFNPGKTLLAVLMLGLSFNTFMEIAPTHPAVLITKEAWADLRTTDVVYVNNATSTPVVEDTPAAIMERIAICESSGKQFAANGALMKHVNKDGSVDFGRFMINDKRHEAQAAKLGMNIYTLEGNTAYAYHLYNTQGTEPWIWTKSCWVKR